MTPLAKQIIANGQANFVLNDKQLARVLDGSAESRYGLVNRALKQKELIRVRRGVYVLAEKYRDYPVHPFALAQQLMPGSYVSVESALSFHGWIPEAVRSVVSVTANGKTVAYDHELLGRFEFQRMSVRPGYFLQAVSRHSLQHQAALVADPLRALLDLAYLRKLPWQGLGYLLDGLRIDESLIKAVPSLDMTKLLDVYKGKREKQFIEELMRSLGL